ncbi:MAG TPA: hypothetical protein VFY69_04485 [Solirubrobacterales bacterium]|nr:hypothetical protein [Solirubrobacterales bacterium]
MKLHMKLAAALAVLSLGLVPAMGVAAGPTYQPEGPKYQPEKPPKSPQGPKAAPKGKAYGYYCRGQSKKRVKGEKGTAFSRCVKALARADRNENLHPKKACRALSKKRVKGQKGTPFSQCVKGVNQMRKAERAAEKATVTASSTA